MEDPRRISETMQDFDGERFYRYDGPKRYFRRPTRLGEQYLHRVVWSQVNGPIPKGAHIHHRDGDRANNALGNLELLTVSEHVRHHRDADPAAYAAERLDGLQKAVVAAKDWHASPAGLEWHRQHAAGAGAAMHERRFACVCERCSSPFMSVRAAMFCSRACKTAARYHAGIDHETRSCAHCGKGFEANRYARTRFCSRSCSSRSRIVTD